MSSQPEDYNISDCKKWAFKAQEKIGDYSPTISNGTIYFIDKYSNLYAVDASTGTEEWCFSDIHGIERCSPVVKGQTVYVVLGANLYAIDASTGDEKWSIRDAGGRSFIGPIQITNNILSIPFVSEGLHLMGIDISTGRKEWIIRNNGLGKDFSSYKSKNNKIYFTTDTGVAVVDALTGTEICSINGEYNHRLAVANGSIYVDGNDKKLYGLSPSTQSERWSFELEDTHMFSNGENSVSSPLTVIDGSIYFGGSNRFFYAVDTATGNKKWSSQTVFDKGASPVVVNNNICYATSSYLCAYDLDTGACDWRVSDIDNTVSPAVVDGTIYTCSGRNLCAILTPENKTVTMMDFLNSTSPSPQKSENDSPETKAEKNPEDHIAMDTSDIETSMFRIPEPEDNRSPQRRNLSLSDFEVIEQIGHGGEAVVEKARVMEPGDPQVVALRKIPGSNTVSMSAFDKFSETAEMWETIDARERNKPHRWRDYEHVVGVIQTGDDLPWIAMEYMNGGDLNELIERNSDGLSIERALWTGVCICRGLEIAHQLGYAHLDIKPENVLLQETDGWSWPKVADWGLARTVANETGTMEGLSPEYAAPEQFDTERFGEPDQVTDIYQAGVVMYELLIGEPPVTGSHYEMIQRIMSGDHIDPISEKRSDIPKVVDETIQLAIETIKEDRYDTITEFRKALESILKDERLPRSVARRFAESY